MLTLARTAEHALRALLYLARLPHAQPTPANRIARDIGAPSDYLGKALQGLAAAGLVRGTRGRRGGYELARQATEITVADVIAAFRADNATGRCILGDRPCSPDKPCIAHVRWTLAQRAANASIESLTIASLAAEPQAAAPPGGAAA